MRACLAGRAPDHLRKPAAIRNSLKELPAFQTINDISATQVTQPGFTPEAASKFRILQLARVKQALTWAPQPDYSIFVTVSFFVLHAAVCSGSMSPSPERSGDNMGGFDAPLGQSCSHATEFLH
jgi:hypothetical protein